MKHLLYKELKLAMHPAALLFLPLSALVLTPNYPYYVTFFYTCLGIFFICLTGRENQDLFFTLLLPVKKRDLVRARMALAVLLQLAQMVLTLPFLALRGALALPENQVGIEANLAFLGLSLLMLGLFNLVFFPAYFCAPQKVGRAFVLGSTAIFFYVAAAETLAHVLPLFRDVLDTPDPQHLPIKLAVLALGLSAYAILTFCAQRVSIRRFEKLDL